jgi:spore coat polysaccharide biosynthesis protein SpsF
VLAPLVGKPLLEVLVERLGGSRVDAWWLATSAQPEDDLTASWGTALGLEVHRGSVDDVLSRFTAIIRAARPEWIVRLTADNPLVDAGVVNAAVEQAGSLGPDCDVVGGDNTACGVPLGYVPEVVRAAALLRLENEIPDGLAYHRSHVTSFLYDAKRSADFRRPSDWPARPAWRWTVDTSVDLAMARAALGLLGDRWRAARYGELVAELDRRPDITAMNTDVVQKGIEEG